MHTESKLITLFKLFRFTGSIPMGLFIFIPLCLFTKNVGYSLVQTIPFVLMISGEIALNDCCDIEKDRISKPHRPLISGSIGIREAYAFTICMLAFAAGIGLWVYRESLARECVFVTVMAILAVYNLRFPFIPAIKAFITAFCTVLSLAFVFTFSIYEVKYIPFLAAAFFFIVGREFLMDIRDIEGDGRNGYKTLAILWGVSKIRLLAFGAIAIADIFCLFCLLFDFAYSKLLAYFLILLSTTVILHRFTADAASGEQNKLAILLWIPIILSLFMII